MSELIALLEKATGPDRALDLDCYWVVVSTDSEYSRFYREASGHRETDVSLGLGPSDWRPWRESNHPRYTASIDAALTLMPDNTGVILYCILGKKPSVSTRRYDWDDHVNAATPAIALCIAALKAREAKS